MHAAINGYFWNRPFVGSGQYTRQLVFHLNKFVSDLKITLIFPQIPGEEEPQDVPPEVLVKRVPAREGHLGKVLFEQQLFPKACREVGADLAHVPYWGAPLRSPVPMVVTVHDLTTLLVPEYNQGAKARLYNALVSASARGANHIITDSFASKLEIVDHLGIGEERITAVYLAADASYTSQENNLVDMAVLRKYELPDFYVLYLGGYENHKNVMTLLLAWTYVGQALGTDYPLVLAGRKPKALNNTNHNLHTICNTCRSNCNDTVPQKEPSVYDLLVQCVKKTNKIPKIKVWKHVVNEKEIDYHVTNLNGECNEFRIIYHSS